MSCARGCCATQAEHYRSVHARGRPPAPKVTVVDSRDTGAEGAVTTEHWPDKPRSLDNRTDVNVTLPTARLGGEYPAARGG